VSYVEVGYQMSERHACRLLGLGRSTHRYRVRKGQRDTPLRTRLKELAAKRMRFGYRRLTAMLVREGMPVNHKRVYGSIARKDWRCESGNGVGSAGRARSLSPRQPAERTLVDGFRE
jgi:putative transposase